MKNKKEEEGREGAAGDKMAFSRECFRKSLRSKNVKLI